MKFKVNTHQGHARIGVLSDFNKMKNLLIETPTCLCYTRHGQIPFLTKEIFNELKFAPKILNIPFKTIVSKVHLLKSSQKGLAEFSRMEEFASILTQSDPAEVIKDGNFADKGGVSIWSPAGRITFKPQDLKDLSEACGADAVQCLTDNETGDENRDRSKRCRKSVDRTDNHLKLLLDLSSPGAAGEYLVSIAGGHAVKERCLSIQKVEGIFTTGYVLDGFRNLNRKALLESLQFVIPTLTECCRLLAKDRFRLLIGYSQPGDVVEAINVGIDLFDGAFPYLITCQHVAWIHHPIELGSGQQSDDDWLNFGAGAGGEQHAVDESALQEDCDCFACRHHTRAYISHLIHTKEILGDILLMIHNSQQYFNFFEEIRNSIKLNEFSHFYKASRNIRCPEALIESSS